MQDDEEHVRVRKKRDMTSRERLKMREMRAKMKQLEESRRNSNSTDPPIDTKGMWIYYSSCMIDKAGPLSLEVNLVVRKCKAMHGPRKGEGARHYQLSHCKNYHVHITQNFVWNFGQKILR